MQLASSLKFIPQSNFVFFQYFYSMETTAHTFSDHGWAKIRHDTYTHNNWTLMDQKHLKIIHTEQHTVCYVGHKCLALFTLPINDLAPCMSCTACILALCEEFNHYCYYSSLVWRAPPTSGNNCLYSAPARDKSIANLFNPTSSQWRKSHWRGRGLLLYGAVDITIEQMTVATRKVLRSSVYQSCMLRKADMSSNCRAKRGTATQISEKKAAF